MGTGVSGVVMVKQPEAKDGCEREAVRHPAGQDGGNDGRERVKTSSDEHQSAEGIAALTLLAS